EFPSVAELRDPKTRLQEWLQARQLGLPTYELIRVSGQAHRQTFEVSCSVAGRQELTSGSGSTLRNAEQEAAERMFLELNQDAAG
ncbi:MAG: putative dsRNA-binding protein, partial [Gammaproteobacteria bacterium]|nr:putative dsRNA-binding protein [Gammaproteobacteria bacterium]